VVDVRDDAEIPYELRIHFFFYRFFLLPIFFVTGRSSNRLPAISRRTCSQHSNDTRKAKTVPNNHSVCHKSRRSAADGLRASLTRSAEERERVNAPDDA
jgi:hypothetical protein